MKAANVIMFICAIAVVGFLLIHPTTRASTDALAGEIVKTCKSASDTSACYEKEVPALYPQYSVTQLFDIIRSVRAKDTSYQFCHVLGHKIGERVVAEDPAKWVDAIPLNPADGLCSNGYIHGVIGGRFRAEVLDDKTIDSLLPDFTRACEPRPNWQPSDLDRAICYHGMGHLYDFITDANLNKALDICKKTVPDGYRRVCTEGVFMQINQPLEPDDYALIAKLPVKLTQGTIRPFCATYKDPNFVGACLRESWPLFEKGLSDGTAAGQFCSQQPNDEQTTNCYQSISAIVGRTSLGKPGQALNACLNYPKERQELCISISAQAILEEERSDGAQALNFCGMAPEGIQEGCYTYLASHAQFVFGEDHMSRDKFCRLMPSEIQSLCEQ